jgi:hypothetical protein
MRTRTRRILTCVAIAAVGLPCALWVIPAPLSGYWHTPLSDCLCDSKNLLSFQDGKAYEWASGHGKAREQFGTFTRGTYWGRWNTGKEEVEIRPGWFLIRTRVGGNTYWGYRELRPSYIREALATKKKKPEQPPQPTAAPPSS